MMFELLANMMHVFPALQYMAVGGANVASECYSTFLGVLVPWYEYLTVVKDPNGICAVQNFNVVADGKTSSFLLIGLAIADDLVRIAALIAAGYVVYGGFKYMTSQGSPDGTKQAQTTIVNALTGLVLAVTASTIVGYLGAKLGGGTNPQGLPDADATGNVLVNAMGLISAIAASICVLVIAIGGFRYVVSHGDPNQITQAKNAILYAIIGLVISISAFSIVTFVLKGLVN